MAWPQSKRLNQRADEHRACLSTSTSTSARADHVTDRVLRTARIWMLAILGVVSVSSRSMAQSAAVSAPPANTQRIARVSVDLAAGAFDRALPFDVPFFMTGRAPEGTVSLEVQFAVLPASGDMSQLLWMPASRLAGSPTRRPAADEAFLVLVRTPAGGRTRTIGSASCSATSDSWTASPRPPTVARPRRTTSARTLDSSTPETSGSARSMSAATSISGRSTRTRR